MELNPISVAEGLFNQRSGGAATAASSARAGDAKIAGSVVGDLSDELMLPIDISPHGERMPGRELDVIAHVKQCNFAAIAPGAA